MTAARPAVEQYDPAVQDRHETLETARVVGLYVPVEHGYCVAVRVPMGQYEPAGQGLEVVEDMAVEGQ